MNEKPDDWYKKLESKPDFDGPKSEGIAGKASGAIKSKAKGGAQKLEERALKEGLKAGVAAISAGAGTAAAPVIDKIDKIPIVKDAFQLLAKIFVPILVIGVLAQMVIGLLAVLMPIIVMTAMLDKTFEAIGDSTVVRSAVMVADGVGEVVDVAKDTAGAVKNGLDAVTPDVDLPCVKVLGKKVNCEKGEGRLNSGTDQVAVGQNSSVDQAVSTTPTTGSVLAAAADDGDGSGAKAKDPNSRLRTLYSAMAEKGFFQMLYTKYGLRVIAPDGENSYVIILNEKIIKTVHSKAALEKEFEKNPKIRLILAKALSRDIHVKQYSQRVTVAEKGLSTYSTSQLFVPGADEAKTPEDITAMRQNSLETQNNPFLGAMTGELSCTQECGSWVPDTVKEDASELSGSISQETAYKTKGTLYSRMKTRLKEAREETSFLEWYQYVREINKAASLTNQEEIAANSFIQGTLKTRKDQSARQWMHWRTTVDQYKSTKMTSESAIALFRNFDGGADSRAYRHISGQPGGKEFKDYQKINDTEDNIVKAIYDTWRADESNEEQAKIVEEVIASGSLDKAVGGGFFAGIFAIFANATTDEETKKAIIDSGFELGQQIMIPVCDGSKTGTGFVNCLYAGAETTARDIGISDYGHKGTITRQEREQVANYVGEMETQMAAEQPLLERLTSIEGRTSFARSFLMNAAIPLNTDTALSSLSSYFMQLPAKISQLAVTSLNPSAMAADDGESINKIKPAGNTLSTLLNPTISATLDDPSGSIASCPATTEEEENPCRTDETAFAALAAWADISTDEQAMTFNVASYNILHADHHTPESIAVGGCNAEVLKTDPTCGKTRTERQAQIIKGQGGAPTLDIIGMQEVSPKQYNQLKTLLQGYESFPVGTSRMSNSKDGAVAIFWNTAKFTQFTKGKAPGTSNTGYGITVPWVGLTAKSGQKVYVMSIHYPNDTFGGTDKVIKRASRQTMEWVKSKATDDAMVIVVGDFNDNLNQKLHYCIYTEKSLMQHAHDMEQGDDPSLGCEKPDTGGIDHIYGTPTLGVKSSGWTHMDRSGIVATASDHEPVYTTYTFPGNGGGNAPIPYKNPVYNGSAPDPGVIRGADGVYHVYATGGVHLSSKDLVTWKKVNGGWGVKGAPRFACDWAPDVAQVGSSYILTWAGIPQCGSVGAIESTSAIRYAIGSSAGGPFQYGGTITDHGYAIDPHLFVDDGKVWLEFGGGNLFIVPMKLTGNTLKMDGAIKTIFRKTSGPTIENGLVRKRDGWYYLFYAQGHWNKSDGAPEYSTKIARSKAITGPYQPTAYKDLLTGGGGQFWGPGGGSITTDNANNEWFVYHDWYKGNRVLMIDPVTYSGGWPTIGNGHPTTTLQQNGPANGAALNPVAGVGTPVAGGWAWPVDKKWWTNQRADFLDSHPTYSGTFTSPYTRGVAVDIGTPPDGSPVYSMLTGVVKKTNLCGAGEGMIIESDTPYGKLQIAYGHGTNPKFQVGQTVTAGSHILNLGAVGCKVSGGHLHIDMALGTKHICPQDVFLAMDKGQSPNLAALTSKAISPCSR